MDLNGKKAIVTGVSKGIGLEVAKLLLHHGVQVAGWSRTAPDIRSDKFCFFATDVSDIDSVNASYNQTVKQFGEEISILINNAGLGYTGPVEEMPVEEWQRMFAVNVNGLFYCSQMVIPWMKEIGKGYIVNIGSIAGTQGSEGLAGYCGTKFAVRGISQAMYKELRAYGVKVSCINPGSVQTHFFDNFENIKVHEHMMKPEWIAESILYILQTPENYHPVELEVRPLMPKGRKNQ